MMAIQVLCAVALCISWASSFPQLRCPSRVAAFRGNIDDDTSLAQFAYRKIDTRTDIDTKRQRLHAKLPKVVSIIRCRSRRNNRKSTTVKSREIPIASFLTELRKLEELESNRNATNEESVLVMAPRCEMGDENTTTQIADVQEIMKRDSFKQITRPSDLQQAVLDDKVPLSEINLKLEVENITMQELLTHEVVELIVKRFHAQSKPGHRPYDDKEILALSLEGGGMRGAVTAGMAAAIASLGLTDCFDRIYGSSAGSVIGAYMVSRQMCMDVYVDILPAAQRKFVCTKRIFSTLAANAFDLAASKIPFTSNILPRLTHRSVPGMNISFVLDGIMHDRTGIRPLDLARFNDNNRFQPLRIASSYAKDGKLHTRCFGTDSFSLEKKNVAERVNGLRHGIFACLEASMTVPGATGPPVPMMDPTGNQSLPYFDAFCFEPLPYRSAVDEGATHVLVLCSRPEGFQPKTKQGIYEKAIAPLYFLSHGQPEVATFFERGGQQYIYAEDLLTLEQGKCSGTKSGGRKPISCPPAKVLYGAELDEKEAYSANNRHTWRKAHVMPLKVPIGTPELKTLEQDRDTVLHAVRGGFAAAFDLFAPAIGLELGNTMTGKQVAELVFPSESRFGDRVLDEQVRVRGDEIVRTKSTFSSLTNPRDRKRRRFVGSLIGGSSASNTVEDDTFDDATRILRSLPGFSSGRMEHLAFFLRRR